MFTILGASGYIGGALVASLRASNTPYLAPQRGDRTIFDRPLGHVIYAIGMTADFRSRPFDTVRAHVSVLTDILENADFNSLTYLSSTRVYTHSPTAATDSRLSVNPADPSDLYNTTKLAGESLCLNCGRKNVRVVRLSNVVGAADTLSDNFIDEIVRDAVRGRLIMRSAPESSKDYICLDDVVRLLPEIASKGTRPVYNVASGRNIRNDEWTTRLHEITGCVVVYEKDAPAWVFPEIDIRATIGEFGFSPRSALDILPVLITRQTPTS